ncbi:MAG: putative ABC transporter permease subunit [Thermodesulfobacteriota bacterium]
MTPLFQPFFHGLRNRFFPGGRISSRTALIFAFGVLLFTALYLVSLKTIFYFHSQNELGVILSLKIFEMAWMLLFTMLIFSSMVSGVSALFLSQDNEIIFASPASTAELYLMRYLTTTFYTSWMVVVFSLPVFGAYGRIFETGPLYLLLLVPTVMATAAIATGIGLASTIILVHLFPARRTKDIVVYLSLLFGILLYLVIRLLRPEDLADPERFPDFIAYLSRMSTPVSPLLPSSWASDLLTGYLQDHTLDWLLAALLLLTPVVIYFAGEWAMVRLFFAGFSKAQESFGGSRRFRPRKYSPSPMRWFFRKEMKIFIRDSTQWSQLFLIGALVVVYLYNFKVLPLERSPLPAEAVANIIAYANIGLTGFIIASLCARFVYPAVGSEGGAFGLILTAPISIRRYLFYKYLFYFVPFTVLTVTLLAASNHLLKISGPMWWISLSTGLVITWSVLAMALGFGSMYADFKAESQAAVLGGFGAIIFLFTAISFELLTILAASIPAYRLVRSWRWGLHFSNPIMAQTAALLLLIMLVGGLIAMISLRKGAQKMAENFH